ncbi:MAG: hypothetical protein A2940_02510 [Candidatus Wildermuthbacteria bacterium RIFCSPLOWO2_01_FULL_48_29]|uniref:Uncharacterized protein n=1 Tax=Candidatus Wildermuthbacteria bacterium RIFCSPLOWO2_01_FULL_48_29 TaxID=1802462 RepID=A0A1G2RL27_9BACT|nr:MAG: hypothetical protein A2940_02510 [Candidatus Wildermuthbacteria bacterium RIFCSPLOWO2_01_FULL_48_29]
MAARATTSRSFVSVRNSWKKLISLLYYNRVQTETPHEHFFSLSFLFCYSIIKTIEYKSKLIQIFLVEADLAFSLTMVRCGCIIELYF